MFIIVDVKGKDFTFKIWKESGSCLEGKKNPKKMKTVRKKTIRNAVSF